MKKSDMMVAIAASLGVGAATFYTMSKSHNPLNKAIENITPMLNNMVQENNSGMQNSTGANQNSQQQSNQQSNQQSLDTMS